MSTVVPANFSSPNPKTPVVFISHDSRDKEIAEAFTLLLDQVGLGYFSSSSPKSAPPYGKEWYGEIVHWLKISSHVVCLITPNSLDRPWVWYEAGLAKTGYDRVIALLVGVNADTIKGSPFGHFECCTCGDSEVVTLLSQLSGKRQEDIRVGLESDVRTFLRQAERHARKRRYLLGGEYPFFGRAEDLAQAGDRGEKRWNVLHEHAAKQLDILGHSLAGVFEEGKGLTSVLRALLNGATVRVIFLDPSGTFSDQMRQVQQTLSNPEDLEDKIRSSIGRALEVKGSLRTKFERFFPDKAFTNRTVADCQSRLQVACSELIAYARLDRADDVMIVSSYSQQDEPGEKAFVQEFRDSDALFKFYTEEFERVWAHAYPAEEMAAEKDTNGSGTRGLHNAKGSGTRGLYHDRARVLEHIEPIREIYRRLMEGDKEVSLPWPRMMVVLPYMDCRLQCANCFTRQSGRMTGDRMSLGVYRHLLAQARDMRVGCVELSGGGEPLEHPEALTLLADLERFGRETDSCVGVLTDGEVLRGGQYADELAEAVAQLDYVRVGHTEFSDQQQKDPAQYLLPALERLMGARIRCTRSDDNDRRHEGRVRIGVKLLLTNNNADQMSRRVSDLLDLKHGGLPIVDHVKIKSIRSDRGDEPSTEDLRRVEHEIATLKRTRGDIAGDVQVDVKSAEVNPATYQCWISPIMTVVDSVGDVFLCCNFYDANARDNVRIGSVVVGGGEQLVGRLVDRSLKAPVERLVPFSEFWGKERHMRVLKRLVGRGDGVVLRQQVCNSKQGCNCRLVHYQKMAEPYARFSNTKVLVGADEIAQRKKML